MTGTAVTITVTGTAEAAAQLAAIGAVEEGPLQAAVMAGALVIQNDAKRRAPFLTGTLRRSIHTEADVAAGGAAATVGTDLEYAAPVEFGHTTSAKTHVPAQPYLRPAADENEPAVVAAIEAVLDAAIAAATGGL